MPTILQKPNNITRVWSDWIFLKMFHIHLNIQRLNIGGFRGDEMDLLDNLDSFHSQCLNLKHRDYMGKMPTIIQLYQHLETSYVERICLNLLLSVNRRVSHCQGGNRPEWFDPISPELKPFQFRFINFNFFIESIMHDYIISESSEISNPFTYSL